MFTRLCLVRICSGSGAVGGWEMSGCWIRGLHACSFLAAWPNSGLVEGDIARYLIEGEFFQLRRHFEGGGALNNMDEYQ